MEEKEIDLLDLLKEILRHWKGIIIYMIMGAVAFMAFGYLKEAYVWMEARQELEKDYADADITPELVGITKVGMDLTDTNQTAVLMVIDDERELSEREKYHDTSVLMDMDPYHIPCVEMVYELSQKDLKENHMLGTMYQDVLSSVGLYDFIEKQTQTSATSAKELVTVSVRSNKDYFDENDKLVLGNDSLKVVIMHADEKRCLEMAAAFKQYIDSLHQEMKDTMGNHDLVLISEKKGFVMDTGVLDKQISSRNACLNLQNTIAKAKDGFTDDQEYYYNLMTGQDKEHLKLEPQISLKMAVLGALVFAFGYCGVWVSIYVMNNKVRGVDNFNTLYGITHFGVIESQNKGIELIITSVKLSLIKNSLNEVYLVTGHEDAAVDKACSLMKEAYEKDGIKVEVLVDILKNAASMERLASIENVVLLEKAGMAKCMDIKEEIDLLKRQDINILGGIIVS